MPTPVNIRGHIANSCHEIWHFRYDISYEFVFPVRYGLPYEFVFPVRLKISYEFVLPVRYDSSYEFVFPRMFTVEGNSCMHIVAVRCDEI